jgi:glycosyltransferase involved in cell wall biosynthesis
MLDAWARRRSRWKKRLMLATVQRCTLERTSCFHATSEREHASIRDTGMRAPVAVIPIGVDIPAPQPPPARSTRRLLYFGRLHPIKGIDVLLRAWSAVAARFPEWELHVIGPDNDGYAAELKSLTAALRAPRIHFRGPAYGEDKWRELAASDLLVLATHSENFGMVVAEALASGVPAIVTRGAPWEGIGRERCGWWIERGNDALVACLEDALSREATDLRAMGQRGRQWMDREFSWRQIAEKMAQMYRWLLEGGRVPEFVRRE